MHEVIGGYLARIGQSPELTGMATTIAFLSVFLWLFGQSRTLRNRFFSRYSKWKSKKKLQQIRNILRHVYRFRRLELNFFDAVYPKIRMIFVNSFISLILFTIFVGLFAGKGYSTFLIFMAFGPAWEALDDLRIVNTAHLIWISEGTSYRRELLSALKVRRHNA